MTTAPSLTSADKPADKLASVDALAPADDLIPSLSPFTLHRVNGLPVEALDVALRETSASLAAETGLEAELRSVAGPLADALHAVVPSLDGAPGVRRTVLALRRAVHNGRPYVLTGDQAREVDAVLDPEARELTRRWLDRMHRLTEARTETDAAYARETAAATERLRELLTHRGLSQGLAHAAPGLLRHLTRKPLHPHGKASRAVFGYASRAALKTSPFSRLTAVALDGGTADGRALTYISQQHVRSWLDLLCRDERLAAAFEAEPNDAVRYVAGRPYIMVPSYNPKAELAWRSDTLADASLYAPLVEEVSSWPRMRVTECLERLGGKDPFAAYVRLLDTGLLRIVTPWVNAEERPLSALARALDRLDAPEAARTAALLREVEAETHALHELSGPERLSVVDRLETVTRTTDDAALPMAPFAAYEDAASDIPVELPGGHVGSDLAELGRTVRPYIFRSYLYDWLVEEFVRRYGEGGRCDDVVRFLWEVAADPAHGQRLSHALMADYRAIGTPTERAWLPVGRSSAPPTTAVLYQLAAESADDVRAGRYKLVVNQYNPGMGGLVARFRKLLKADRPGETDLTEGLRTWIGDSFPEAEPLQVTLSGDVNGMHYAAAGVLPPFHWPGEPGSEGVAPDGAPVALHHDAETGTLEMTGALGQAVAPVYLGVVPSHLVSGVARLLLCLADPWVNGSRLCCTRSPLDTDPPLPDGAVEELPGDERGRLVLGRRAWRFAPGQMPRPEPGEGAEEFFRRVHRWRTGHGMPDEVFLSLSGSPSVSSAAVRKPLWLSFRSPHAVWAAVHHTRDLDPATSVRLAEALPGPTGHWIRDDDGMRHATEHVSLLRWDRPRPGRENDGGHGPAPYARLEQR
ncbi:hypothetical protein ACH427_18615 [Streptomyces sp. NPDC020379]|uniref:hypothetical protein n=1 Tax=Streptomyces sp. NPDC020379 TaxID=3365071 RepID=UPI0037B58D1B